MLRILAFKALDPVAAAGPLAAVGAVVLIDPVAVVAGFAQVNASVAATLPPAAAGTTVAILVVPIIASFVAFVFWGEITAKNPVAAAGFDAAIGAGIGVFVVAIVTGFPLGQETVAAATAAGICATIIRDLVPIVAGFEARLPPQPI